jgi:hypothetical protein
MRKTARDSSVAVTKFFWLGIPDNRTPIRWMGCWTAVYGSAIREKADRRAERSRTRRGSKKRGTGSSERRKAVRARGRAARDEALSSFPRMMEKSMQAMSRIDKRHERACKFALGFTARRVVQQNKLESLEVKIKDLDREIEVGDMQPSNRPHVDYNYRKRLSSLVAKTRDRLRSLSVSEIRTYSRVYGLPFASAKKRAELSTKLDVTVCIPRASLEYAVFWRTWDHPAPRRELKTPIRCRCKRCRFVTECPCDAYVPPEQKNCTVCGWLRHGNSRIGRP